MAGLVLAIHAFVLAKTWMPGTRPGMTASRSCRYFFLSCASAVLPQTGSSAPLPQAIGR
jgi:hypothetical protein